MFTVQQRQLFTSVYDDLFAANQPVIVHDPFGSPEHHGLVVDIIAHLQTHPDQFGTVLLVKVKVNDEEIHRIMATFVKGVMFTLSESGVVSISGLTAECLDQCKRFHRSELDKRVVASFLEERSFTEFFS